MDENIQPTYTILAGVNGVGKSTFRQMFKETFENKNIIDPDYIAKSENKTNMEAGRTAIKRINNFFESKESFFQETTLASNLKKNISLAKLQGYKTEVVYISLPNAEMSIKNIENRVRQGGHDIPEATVRDRYNKSFKNLEEVSKRVDRVLIVENSNKDYKSMLKIEHGEVQFKSNKIPEYLKPTIEKVIENNRKFNEEKVFKISEKDFKSLENNFSKSEMYSNPFQQVNQVAVLAVGAKVIKEIEHSLADKDKTNNKNINNDTKLKENLLKRVEFQREALAEANFSTKEDYIKYSTQTENSKPDTVIKEKINNVYDNIKNIDGDFKCQNSIDEVLVNKLQDGDYRIIHHLDGHPIELVENLTKLEVAEILVRKNYKILNNDMTIDKTLDIKQTRVEKILEKVNEYKLRIKPIKGKLDLKNLKDINKALGGSGVIESDKSRQAREILKDLKNENFLKGCNKEEFSQKASAYINKLDNIGLFKNSNEATVKEFTKNLGKSAGYNINLNKVSNIDFKFSCTQAQNGNNTLKNLIKDNTLNNEPQKDLMKDFDKSFELER